MERTIKNVISSKNVPQWGNGKKYIAIHYLGVVGQNNKVEAGGYGAHYYIYWDGTIYQAASHDAVLWQVGTGGYYKQKHPIARNANTIGIELCCKCDGDSSKAGDKWYFTEETQEACVWLVKKLMKDLGIPASNVLRHYDIVDKTCPAPYVHNNKYKTSWTWDEFKKKITNTEVSSGTTSTTKPANQGQNATDKMYRIRTSWNNAGSQIGAYENLELAKKACKPGYTVYNWNGVAVYSVASYPWVGACTGNNVNIRKGPGTGYGLIKGWPKLNTGNLFDVTGKTGKWYKILIAKKYDGYIFEDYVKRM